VVGATSSEGSASSFRVTGELVDLPWRKSLDVVVGERDMYSLVLPAVEDVVTTQVARVEPGVVGRRELSATLVCTSHVEQTRCSRTRNVSSRLSLY